MCCAGREEALPYYAALRGRADYAASAPPWQRALLTFQHANLLTERGADGDEEEAEALYGEIVAEPVRTKPAPEFSRAGRLESELPFVGRTRTSMAGSVQRMSRWYEPPLPSLSQKNSELPGLWRGCRSVRRRTAGG